MKSSQKKILFYTKDLNGGVAKFLENIIPLLQEKGWQAKLICHQSSHSYNLSPELIGWKIDRQINFSLKNTFINIRNLKKLFFAIKNSQAKIIYSIDLYANINTLLIRQFFPNKIFVNNTQANFLGYLSDRKPLLRKLLTFIAKNLYKKSDLHIVPSVGLRKQLIALLGIKNSKIITLPNFINAKKIIFLSKKPIKNKNIIQMLTGKNIFKIFIMARFEQQKKINNLFPLLKKNKKYQLFLLGSGPLKPQYLKEIRRLKIDKQVIFLGWQENPYQFLPSADVFVNLSKYEGFPFVLLEAMTLGLPIVASDVNFGPREIINKQTGILITDQKTTTIDKAIRTALKNKKMFQKNSRKRALDFDYRKIFPLYLDLLEKLIKRSS